jgi:hypothetical protein
MYVYRPVQVRLFLCVGAGEVVFMYVYRPVQVRLCFVFWENGRTN